MGILGWLRARLPDKNAQLDFFTNLTSAQNTYSDADQLTFLDSLPTTYPNYPESLEVVFEMADFYRPPQHIGSNFYSKIASWFS